MAAVLGTDGEPMGDEACRKDDQSNAPSLCALLGALAGAKKVTP